MIKKKHYKLKKLSHNLRTAEKYQLCPLPGVT